MADFRPTSSPVDTAIRASAALAVNLAQGVENPPWCLYRPLQDHQEAFAQNLVVPPVDVGLDDGLHQPILVLPGGEHEALGREGTLLENCTRCLFRLRVPLGLRTIWLRRKPAVAPAGHTRRMRR